MGKNYLNDDANSSDEPKISHSKMGLKRALVNLWLKDKIFYLRT